jgi:dCMP deaminase
MKKILILYIPVLHEGYRRILELHKNADAIYIFGKEIITDFDYLSKEIRALDPLLIKKAITAWGFTNVKILTSKQLAQLNNETNYITLPDEDVCRELTKKYLKKAHIAYDQVFLRWDKYNATLNKPVDIDQHLSIDEFDRSIILKAEALSHKSSDWWRHVGAVIVKNKKIILTGYNHHVPSPHTPYINGDPRNGFHKGINIEIASAIHAEAFLIAEAARQGINLTGASLYVSTFPCPVCAKQVAYSGIKKLYYSGGYGVLDADDILKSQGIEITYVDMTEKNEGTSSSTK